MKFDRNGYLIKSLGLSDEELDDFESGKSIERTIKISKQRFKDLKNEITQLKQEKSDTNPDSIKRNGELNIKIHAKEQELKEIQKFIKKTKETLELFKSLD